MSASNRAVVVPSAQTSPLLTKAPLGHFQVLCLSVFHSSGGTTSAGDIRDILEAHGRVDLVHVHSILRGFEDAKLIVEESTKRVAKRGPPRKYFKITEAGEDILMASVEHYRSVSEFIGKMVS